jgi:hypothetical protein
MPKMNGGLRAHKCPSACGPIAASRQFVLAEIFLTQVLHHPAAATALRMVSRDAVGVVDAALGGARRVDCAETGVRTE